MPDGNKQSLNELQQRINKSRDYYLEQSNCYEAQAENVEREIIDEFLVKFCDGHPDWAETATAIARETIDEISDFHTVRTDIAVKVMIAAKRSEGSAYSLQIASLQAVFDDLNAFCDDVLATVSGDQRSKKGQRPDVAETLKEHHGIAQSICLQLIPVQALSGDILLMRHEVLKSIKQGYLSVSFSDVVENIGRHLADTPRDELISKSWDAVAEAVSDAIEIILDEELPTSRVRRVLEALQKSIGMQKVDTDPTGDGTNKMLKLLPLLRSNRAALTELDMVFAELMQTIDKLDDVTHG